MKIYSRRNQYIDWKAIHLTFDVQSKTCLIVDAYKYYFYVGIKYFDKVPIYHHYGKQSYFNFKI